eukprot:12407250-Karenia_brevis.AAC.1
MLGIDESGVPMLILMQKQAAFRETDEKQMERTTAMAVENIRSIRQLETNKLLVVNGMPEVWKDWQGDQVLWKMVNQLTEKQRDITGIQHNHPRTGKRSKISYIYCRNPSFAIQIMTKFQNSLLDAITTPRQALVQ